MYLISSIFSLQENSNSVIFWGLLESGWCAQPANNFHHSVVRPGYSFHDVTFSTFPHAIWGFNLEDMPISLTVKNVELNAVEDRGSG